MRESESTGAGALLRGQTERVSYNVRAVHDSLPTASDAYHRSRRL
ncbi:hypothetical protein [Streptomyces sp. NPDC093105]